MAVIEETEEKQETSNIAVEGPIGGTVEEIEDKRLTNIGKSLEVETPPERETVIRQAPEKSTWQQIKERLVPGIDPAEATQALIDAETFGVSPSQALTYKDQIKEGIKLNPKALNLQSTVSERFNQRWDIGVTQSKMGYLGFQMLFNDSPDLIDNLNNLRGKIPTEEERFIPKNIFDMAIGSTAEMLPILLQGSKRGLEKGLILGAGAAGITALAGQVGPQILTPEEVITVPVAFTSMFGVGVTAGTLENISQIEAGLGFVEIFELKDAEGNQIDPVIAKTAAAGIGIINGLLEIAQIKTLIKTIPGGQKLLNKVIRDTTKEVLTDGTLKAIAQKFVKQFGGFITKETAQELAQESTNIIATELSKKINNELKGTDIEQTTIDEIVERLAETAKQSALSFAVLGLPGTVSQAAIETGVPQKLSKKIVELAEGLGEEGAIDFFKDKDPEEFKKEVITELEKGKILPLEVLEQFKGEPIVDKALAEQRVEEEVEISEAIKPLVEEAKKFDTAEEFVGSQTKAFHGTDKEFDKFITIKEDIEFGPFTADGVGVHFGTAEQAEVIVARRGSGKVKEFFLDIKNPIRLPDGTWSKSAILLKLRKAEQLSQKEWEDLVFTKDKVDIEEVLNNLGFDSIVYENTGEGVGGDSFIIFNNKQIKTETQLTEIFNQAKAKPVSKEVKEKKPKKFDPQKDSLKDFVRLQGGIDIVKEGGGGLTGELTRLIDFEKGKQIVKEGKGLSVDDMRVAAMEQGFIDDFTSPSEFLEILEGDLSAETEFERVFSTAKDFTADIEKEFKFQTEQREGPVDTKKIQRLEKRVETLKEKSKADLETAREKLKDEKGNLQAITKARISEERKKADIKKAEAKIDKAIDRIEILEKKDKQIARAVERGKITLERTKAISRETIEGLKHKGELVQLRQRIQDRVTFIARGVREGTITAKKDIKAVQSEIIDILDTSELEAKDKAKFIKTIKNTQTQAQLERRMPLIEKRIDQLTQAAEVRKFKSDVKKTLKTTKPISQPGKPRGKFTPEIQKELDDLRKANNLTQTKAEEKIYQNIDLFPTGQIPPEVAKENKILAMMSGLEQLSPREYETLLDGIKDLIEKGKTLNELRKFNIQSDIIEKQDFVVDTVTESKGIAPGRETTGPERKVGLDKFMQEIKSLGRQYVLSYHDLLGTLAWNIPSRGPAMKKTFGVQKETAENKRLQAAYVDDFNAKFANAYGIKNNPLSINRKIIENNQIVDDLGTFVNASGREVTIQRTRDELIKRWMEMQDPTLEESLIQGNKFTPEIMQAIEEKLTPQDKAWGNAQLGMYRRQYDAVNEVYRTINGIDLPFNLFYSPIKRVGFEVDTTKGFGEFLEEASYRNAVTNKSFISRVKNVLPIEWQGSTEVLNRHMTDTNYYIAWVEKVRELDRVFKANDVREAITQEFGRNLLAEIFSHLDDFSTNRNAKENNRAADWFRKNFTLGALMLKPSLTIKQLVSTFAYMEVLSPRQLVSGTVDFLKSPIKNVRILQKESEFFRLRGSDMERDIQAAIGTDDLKRYSVKNTFTNFAMMNVRLGDKGAIALGAWSMRKAGFTTEQWEIFSQETQQSADSGQLSNVQKGGSFAKLFTMFMSSQRQYLAKELNAVASLFQKDGTSPANIKRVARIIAIYHIILPVTFQMVANFGGTDEDDLKEYIRAGVLGSLNGLFIFGQVIDSFIRAALKMRVFKPTVPILTVGKDISRAISILRVEDITDEEVMDAIEKLLRAARVTGLPFDQALNISKGIGDLVDGNIKQGVGEILGWSEFHLKGSKDKPKATTTRRLKQ